MIRPMRRALQALLLIGIAGSAWALPVRFEAPLNGASESPANASPGRGFAEVIFDDDANTMRVHVIYEGLLAPVTASHIHCCTALSGVGSDAVASAAGNAGVATQTPSFIGFPAGTSGEYDHTFDMSLVSSYRPGYLSGFGGDTEAAADALLTGMFDGKAYLNIHTTLFTGGEIRGFLRVPEPATWALALLPLALLLRRRTDRA